ncbi:MAG: hypothetical protein ABI541_10790 [Betaproteobacteria bacterium]
MCTNFASDLPHPLNARESLLGGDENRELRAAGRRASETARRDAPSRRYRLPPTRAARSPRGRGVFFAPGKRMLSAVVIAAALFTLAAMLGTTAVVDSATFNANAGPRLVASASLAPAPILALSR